ncbi:protein SEH1 [Eutrema salsugineum]|uniref:protein SEH1 n=1 Tax=Eutrema salsugineum TaxID=72664 RepID=UPI000CED37FA|nr:protein SEH1 [Eutrema salsugineum]
MATLDSGTTCSSWNHSGHRLATGSLDGILSVYDSPVPSSSSSSSFTCTSKVRVSESSVAKIVWLPSEYGDAVACICEDGSLSIWEEVSEDTHALEWKSCKSIKNQSSQVLDVQFGVSRKSLKMATNHHYWFFDYYARSQHILMGQAYAVLEKMITEYDIESDVTHIGCIVDK